MANEFSHIFDLREDGALVVKVPFIRVYIPESYINHNITEIVGQDVDTIALFEFDTFGENEKTFDEDNPYKNPTRYFMKIPTYMRMCPRDILKERNEEKQLFTILEFMIGDLFFQSTNVAQDWKTVSKVVELLIKAFLPKELRYDQIVDFVNECCAINKVDLEVSDTVLEILVAELSRNPDNLNESFRQMIKNSKVLPDMTSKQMIAIERLGRINNTFAAIGSGDQKLGIITSVVRSKLNEPEKESSIEQVLTDV